MLYEYTVFRRCTRMGEITHDGKTREFYVARNMRSPDKCTQCDMEEAQLHCSICFRGWFCVTCVLMTLVEHLRARPLPEHYHFCPHCKIDNAPFTTLYFKRVCNVSDSDFENDIIPESPSGGEEEDESDEEEHVVDEE